MLGAAFSGGAASAGLLGAALSGGAAAGTDWCAALALGPAVDGDLLRAALAACPPSLLVAGLGLRRAAGWTSRAGARQDTLVRACLEPNGRLVLVTSAAVALLGVACSGGDEPAAEAAPELGSVVVGITSDLALGSDVARMRIRQRVNDEDVADEVVWAPAEGEPPPFPREIAFRDREPGTRVEVAIDVFATVFSDEPPLFTRLASTNVAAGRSLLLRVRVEEECIPGFRIEGGENTPVCTPPETCVATTCRPSFVPPDMLESYSPSWSEDYPDACKPEGAGEPSLEIGQGEQAFAPLADGEVVEPELGPQGGYHIWLALRMRNLHQAGTQTLIKARSPELGIDLNPMHAALGYEATGGACELAGLKFLLLHAGATDFEDVTELFGQPLDLTVTVSDAMGDIAQAARSIRLGGEALK